jgi:hypothetical protein
MGQEMEQETKGPHIRIRLDVPHQPTVPAVTFTVPFESVTMSDDYDYYAFTLLPHHLDFTASHDLARGLYDQYALAMETAARSWRKAFELINKKHEEENGQ